MKKIISCILASLLILTSLSSIFIFALDEEKALIAFNTVEADNGETVSLQLTLSNNPGIAGLVLSLKYDTNSLTLTKTEKGTLFGSYSGEKNYTWDEDRNVTEDGVLATFYFEVSETALPGDYEIEIIVRTCIDIDLEDIPSKILPGVIKVKADTVSVSGVTLDKKILSMDVNESENLIAIVSPENATNKGLMWKSSNESVVSVEDGKVTAVGYGTATVTVTTADGGFTDSCVVTVACKHAVKTCTDEKKATCKEGGWEAYCVCDTCGQIFTADGETELDAIPVTSVNKNNHVNVQSVPEDEATCVNQGHDAYEKCLDCGAITSGSDNMYYGDHNYGELIPATAEKHTATELKPAISAHYQCSLCEKYFTEDKDETSYEALVGETPSHKYGDTWYNDGTNHWKECDCGDKAEKTEHSYDNDYDTTCNDCGYTRTVEHDYGDTWYNDETNHWKECACGDKSEIGEHDYTDDCDTTCDTCGYTRTVEHDYGDTWYNDETNHWKECACGDKSEIGEHDYTDDSDATCNTCGYTRTVEHDYGDTWYNDETNHWKECACGDKSEIGEHDYTDDCDTTCDTCGYIRTIKHEYGNTWYNDETNHWKECACGDKAEISEHNYDDNCDESCNTCGYNRTVEHNYGDTWHKNQTQHWKECACGDVSEKGTHTYGDWVITEDATSTEPGEKEKECSVCGHKVVETIPATGSGDQEPQDPPSPPNHGNHGFFGIIGVIVCTIFKFFKMIFIH